MLDDLATGSETNVNTAAKLVLGDVCDIDVLRRCIAGVDVVFHLAAAARNLAWSPRTSMAEGMARTVARFEQQGDR